MTKVRVMEIRMRRKDISPAPWCYNSYSGVFSVPLEDMDAYETFVCWVPAAYGDTATKQGEIDAEFIAYAPQDIDYLLEENKRMMEQNTQLIDELWYLTKYLVGKPRKLPWKYRLNKFLGRI